MLNFLRVSVSALALTAFVAAPIATVLTTDYAYAKNGNGNGGGKGGEKGGNGGGKGGDKGAKSGAGSDSKLNRKSRKSANKGDKSKRSGRLGRAVKEDFQTLGRNLQKNGIKGLFKGNKTKPVATSANKSTVKPVQKPQSKKTKIVDDGTLAPRNLGKLNGAINSSINAKLAHIANGQYAKGAGPVSLAAGLAVADANFNHVMGEDYTLSPADLKDVAAAYDYLDTASMTLEEAEKVLADEMANPGVTDPEDLADAQAVKDAHDAILNDDGNAIERPTEDQLAAAEAVHDAEASLLGHYKGDFSEDDVLAAEQQERVLDAVRSSNPDAEAVKATLDATDSEADHASSEDNDEIIDQTAEEGQPSNEDTQEELANNG
ncbi:hypothetical protein K3740_20200 (plasmid) [Ruegeria conchae]|uniref:hypothetical protein n=1 Tax=Ruegeria conchae TaxID=981384 RepID=UPI0021A3319A|nr:hypothetical protein [Ruegeria conchae]UWR05588.1 hypothetical protein K3740_20200 [Ruegeria conchae]